MDTTQLTTIANRNWLHNEPEKVVIRLTQPSVGRIANSPVKTAYSGFDWENGLFIILPDEELVSVEWLEKLIPDIRRQISAAMKAKENEAIKKYNQNL